MVALMATPALHPQVVHAMDQQATFGWLVPVPVGVTLSTGAHMLRSVTALRAVGAVAMITMAPQSQPRANTVQAP